MYIALFGLGVLALVGGIIALVVLILFLLNLMRLLEAVQPQNRAMSPGLVWLNVIPIFTVGWMIYTVLKISESVQRENAWRRGSAVNDQNIHTVGLVYAILGAVAFVLGLGRYGYRGGGFEAFGGLVSLAGVIAWIIYWVRTNRVRRDLERTAGAGYGQPGPYGSGYGQPGPYGSGYGQPGPGALGYGAYPTGQPGTPPPGWQPPAATPPPSGETPVPTAGPESGRACSQCGKELDPDDQFCGACGTPVPKG
jgi:hypothetical protein